MHSFFFLKKFNVGYIFCLVQILWKNKKYLCCNWLREQWVFEMETMTCFLSKLPVISEFIQPAILCAEMASLYLFPQFLPFCPIENDLYWMNCLHSHGQNRCPASLWECHVGFLPLSRIVHCFMPTLCPWCCTTWGCAVMEVSTHWHCLHLSNAFLCSSLYTVEQGAQEPNCFLLTCVLMLMSGEDGEECISQHHQGQPHSQNTCRTKCILEASWRKGDKGYIKKSY